MLAAVQYEAARGVGTSAGRCNQCSLHFVSVSSVRTGGKDDGLGPMPGPVRQHRPPTPPTACPTCTGVDNDPTWSTGRW
jgi:hypothetical protein